jgi:hypothetical protein
MLPVARSAEPVRRGILVLDDCDPDYKGKKTYKDNLTLIDPAKASVTFRLSGFNHCQSVGSHHVIATDLKRGSIWLAESVAKRLRKFDLAGEEIFEVPELQMSAISVDPETGNLWILVSTGTIYGSETFVISPDGKLLARHEFSGCDIAYDKKEKAFWISSNRILKVDARSQKVLVDEPVAAWCAPSLAVHPVTGKVWVGARQHPDVRDSKDEVLRLSTEGKVEQSIPQDADSPFHVSISEKTGSIWVTFLRRGVRSYSSEGKLERFHKAEALAACPDPETNDVWIATPEDIQCRSAEDKVLKTVRHVSKSSQVWMSGLE